MNALALRTTLIMVLLLSAARLNGGAADGQNGLTHIGTQKQLFIDDYIVEQMSHVKRVLNHGVKAPNNPVVRADRPWETNYLRLNKIVYDDKDGLFKMWYSATDEFKPKKEPGAGYRVEWTLEGDSFARVNVPDPYGYYGDPNGDGSKLCLATSKDGVHWGPTLERWSTRDPATTTSCRQDHGSLPY